MSKELWSEMDELGYQMGDMHGEWENKRRLKRWQKKSVPVKIRRITEAEKKHIKRSGK